MPHVIDPELRPLHVDVYMALRESWRDYGFGASQAEISKACRCSATSVNNALRVLRKKGYITGDRFRARSIRPTDLERTIARERDPWGGLADRKYFKLARTPEAA